MGELIEFKPKRRSLKPSPTPRGLESLGNINDLMAELKRIVKDNENEYSKTD